MAARRTAIMAGARDMLAEKNVGDISLRELSDRVGLAKSNVLRYFDSREAIFLEVLDEEFQAWLGDIEDRLGRPRARKAGYANEIRVARVIADSVGHGPCCASSSARWPECWNATSPSSSPATSRRGRWRESPRWPNSSAVICRGCPGVHRVLRRGRAYAAAGMYPFSVPTEPVRAAIAEIGLSRSGAAVRRRPAGGAGDLADWRGGTDRGVTDFRHEGYAPRLA